MPFENLLKFIDAVAKVQSRDELLDHLQDMTIRLGFSAFALVEHAARIEKDSPSPLAMSTYPSDWVRQYHNLGLHEQDPVRMATKRTLVGFRWSDMAALIDIGRVHKAHMAAARRSGIRDGYTVPIHAPDGTEGSVSFAVVENTPLPEHNLPLAQLVGVHAYEAARRLAAAD